MNWLKLLPCLACVLAGMFAGQLIQAKVFAQPCPTVAVQKCPDCKCPDCKCPPVKPCPPVVDFSKFKADKKGKYEFKIYMVDTTKLR